MTKRLTGENLRRAWQLDQDMRWMHEAIVEAKRAMRDGEAPFGAVVVQPIVQGSVVWSGRGSGTQTDPIRHSEIRAIQEACAELDRPELLRGCTLYSTHEPCFMCCGAAIHAKVSRVVFGSYRDDRPDLFTTRRVKTTRLLGDCSTPAEVVGGILRAECIDLFKDWRIDGRRQSDPMVDRVLRDPDHHRGLTDGGKGGGLD